MGLMRVLDHTGDLTVDWEPSDVNALKKARELFDQLGQQGRVAFQRTGGTREFERVEHFDAAAAEIIWIRPIQGG